MSPLSFLSGQRAGQLSQLVLKFKFTLRRKYFSSEEEIRRPS